MRGRRGGVIRRGAAVDGRVGEGGGVLVKGSEELIP